MVYALTENPLKVKLRDHKCVFGMYTYSSDPLSIEVAAAAGFDFIRLDWCHAPYDFAILATLIRAAENSHIVPFVRLEYNPFYIATVLDLGAMGIIVPGVDTAEKAQAIVDAAKFPPYGKRGFFSASRKAGFGGGSPSVYAAWGNESIMVAVQIESVEGMNNLNRILDVPGIDIVHSGRNDLSESMGHMGQPMHPEVLKAEQQIFTQAINRGMEISPQLNPFSCTFSDDLANYKRLGAKIFSLGIDVVLTKQFYSGLLDKVKI